MDRNPTLHAFNKSYNSLKFKSKQSKQKSHSRVKYLKQQQQQQSIEKKKN